MGFDARESDEDVSRKPDRDGCSLRSDRCRRVRNDLARRWDVMNLCALIDCLYRASQEGLRARVLSGIAVAVLIGCTPMTAQERRLVVLNEGPLSQRLRIAREYATSERQDTLRAAVRTHFPTLTDRDVALLRLGWERMTLAQEDAVVVVITFDPLRGNRDAAAIADYCAGLVRSDLALLLLREGPSTGATKSPSRS